MEGQAVDVSNSVSRKDLIDKVKDCMCHKSVLSVGIIDYLHLQVHLTFDGKLDLLVNNVGTNVRKPTVEYTESE